MFDYSAIAIFLEACHVLGSFCYSRYDCCYCGCYVFKTNKFKEVPGSISFISLVLIFKGHKMENAFQTINSSINGTLEGDYQTEGVKWMLSREFTTNIAEYPKGGFLADDMGLGKTNQTIAVIVGNPTPTLIVTEVATLPQWRDSLITFGNIKPAVLNASFKPTLLPNDIKLVLTTYSVFQRPQGCPQCLKNFDWGRIVLDEGHNISNPRTKLFKELSTLTSPIKWVLSATPIQNGEKDILSQARWIGINTTNLEDIYNTYLLRRTQSKIAKENPELRLPPLESEIVLLPFKYEEEKWLYKMVEKHFSDKLAEIAALPSSNSKASITALEGMLRCKQICAHPIMFYEKEESKAGTKRKNQSSTDTHLKSTKIEYLVDYVKGLNDHPKTLIFCSWRREMQLISEALRKEGIQSLVFDGQLSKEQKENTLYNFINMSIPVLILQVKCGSTGLNLQCATHVIITAPNWNPMVDLQAIGRSHRKGQNQKVKCIRIVMQNTVEERCLKINETKAEFIAETMKDESIRNRLGTPSVELTTAEIYDLFGLATP